MCYTMFASSFCLQRSHGHNCDRDRFSYYASKGDVLVLTGERTRKKWERMPISLSFGYTQTIMRLYPNNCVPIRKMKHTFGQCVSRRAALFQGPPFLVIAVSQALGYFLRKTFLPLRIYKPF